MAAPSAEVQFAQRLAANDKKTRDKALKKLRKYIRSRSATKTGLSESDLVKLWKGLHYCMWMQDKPLLQEELAVHISRLLFSFSSSEGGMTFFKVFLITEAREWNGIDRLRLDKFMMLVRQMLNQTFVLLKQDGWREDGIETLVAILNLTLLNTDADNIPDSLSMHMADIFIPELTKVGWEQLDSQKILSFLKVFDSYLQIGKRPLVTKRILGSVYNTVIEQTVERLRQAALREAEQEGGDKEDGGTEEEEDSDSGYDEDSEPRLKFDCELIASHLFEIGSSDKCCGSNRQKLYSTVKHLRDAVSGGTEVMEDEREEYDPDEDFEDAVMRLNQLNTVKKRKKRKHEEEDDKTESEVNVTSTTDAAKKGKSRKKKKRKLEEDAVEETMNESGVKKVKLISSNDSKSKSDNTKKSVKPESDSPKLKKKKKKKKKAKQMQDMAKDDGKGDNSVNAKEQMLTNNSEMKNGAEDNFKDVKVNENVSVSVFESVSVSVTKKKAKKKKKQKSEEEADEADMTPAKKLKTESQDNKSSDKVSKTLFKDKTAKKSKGEKKAHSEFDRPLEKGEVEIWVPSRKYQNKVKVMQEKVGVKENVDVDSGTDDSVKLNKTPVKCETEHFQGKVKKLEQTPGDVLAITSEAKSKDKDEKKKRKSSISAFAQFEKISTPPAAFVKKAIAKAALTPSKQSDSMMESTPKSIKSTPKVKGFASKMTGSTPENIGSTPQMTASEKKVKFNMKKNTAQKFEDSMKLSPLPAFVPTKSPTQGILKSPLLATPASGKKSDKKKKRKLKLQNSPGNTSVYSPGNTPGKTPSKTPGKSIGSTPGKTGVKVPGETPGKSLEKTPGKTQEKTTGKHSGKTPGKNLEKTPGKTTVNTPGKHSGKTPGKNLEKTPGKTAVNTPGKNSGKTPLNTPGKNLSNTPGKIEVNPPEKTPGSTKKARSKAADFF